MTGLLSALVLAASFATPATAVDAPSGADSAREQALAEASAGQDCIYVQAVTITLEGDDTTYALNEQGEVVPSAPDVTTDGCVASSSPSPGQVSPMVISYGTKDFTSGSNSYAKTDTNGIFSSQVAPGSVALAWAYSISIPLQAISAGSATATVARTPGNCSYSKVGVTTAYLFHGSCPSHVYSNPYALNGVVTFPIQVSGVPGTATIEWVFNYKIRSI